LSKNKRTPTQAEASTRIAGAPALDPKRDCLASSTDTIGRCESAFEQLAPAVGWLCFLNEAKIMIAEKTPRSTPQLEFSTFSDDS
jgi:hypothetical protein